MDPAQNTADFKDESEPQMNMGMGMPQNPEGSNQPPMMMQQEPMVQQPIMQEPVIQQPVLQQPVVQQPALVNVQPASPQVVTLQPTVGIAVAPGVGAAIPMEEFMSVMNHKFFFVGGGIFVALGAVVAILSLLAIVGGGCIVICGGILALIITVITFGMGSPLLSIPGMAITLPFTGMVTIFFAIPLCAIGAILVIVGFAVKKDPDADDAAPQPNQQ